jgi:N-acetylglucosaminyldiphosphoundecaprenol N-acetyl-beta-D-mannosaminyltransferase
MKEKILGYLIDSNSLNGCINEIMNHFGNSVVTGFSTFAWLACLNPHSFAMALEDSIFSKALRDADWLVPDGVGIVWASRMLDCSVRERLTGSDIFFGLNDRMNTQGGFSAFFLGATEDSLELISTKMAIDYPNIRVAGTYSPPFKPAYSDQELDAMIVAINATRPDVLWVGMTAPKQENWIFENKSRLEVQFAAAIGAVFDFYTGKVKRSHPVFQRLGLEWLPRLVQQPKRLWKRMFLSAPIFVWHVIKQKILKIE